VFISIKYRNVTPIISNPCILSEFKQEITAIKHIE